MDSMLDSIEGAIVVIVRWMRLGVEIFGTGLVSLGVRRAIINASLL
jgi:hypothetical protein